MFTAFMMLVAMTFAYMALDVILTMREERRNPRMPRWWRVQGWCLFAGDLFMFAASGLWVYMVNLT